MGCSVRQGEFACVCVCVYVVHDQEHFGAQGLGELPTLPLSPGPPFPICAPGLWSAVYTRMFPRLLRATVVPSDIHPSLPWESLVGSIRPSPGSQ